MPTFEHAIERAIEHDGRRISYEETGAGPTLLLLPPGASPAAAWRPVMERLADRFHMVAINFAGYGGTERLGDHMPRTLEAEARDTLGRDYYERGAEEGRGYRNGNRTGRLKTA